MRYRSHYRNWKNRDRSGFSSNPDHGIRVGLGKSIFNFIKSIYRLKKTSSRQDRKVSQIPTASSTFFTGNEDKNSYRFRPLLQEGDTGIKRKNTYRFLYFLRSTGSFFRYFFFRSKVDLTRSTDSEKVHPPSPLLHKRGPILRYYLGFFLILGFLPLFYFDAENESLFLNWVQAHGLRPHSSVTPSGDTKTTSSFSKDGKDNLPQVVLLRNNDDLRAEIPQFHAGFNSGLPFFGNGDQKESPPSESPEYAIDPSRAEDGKDILNYESTNEIISEDRIGDWVDENERNVFEQELPNPYISEEENLWEKAFNHRHYRVVAGDSLWSISKRFNISIDSIISLNGITAPQSLTQGKEILIPQMSGVYYRVKKNDSLFNIAKEFSVGVEKIQKYNELGGYLQIGKTLFLPGGKYSRFQKDYIFGNLFITPVSGALTSKYGFRSHPIKGKRLFHTGIDIAKNAGERIRAAADGVVVQAGPNGGYGEYVMIKHGLGYETAYAHLSAVWVKPGQKVKKGQYIGRVGNTGLSTGHHLHFEVKQNGKFINPLRFVRYR